MQLRRLQCLWYIWNYYNLFSYMFLGSELHAFIESSEKFWKFRFLGYFSESTTEDYKQKYWSVRKRFEITIPSWATYLEVSAHISLKIARESFLEAKILRKFWFLGTFLKQKRRGATKTIGVTVINLAWLCLVQPHIVWKWVHAFHGK